MTTSLDKKKRKEVKCPDCVRGICCLFIRMARPAPSSDVLFGVDFLFFESSLGLLRPGRKKSALTGPECSARRDTERLGPKATRVGIEGLRWPPPLLFLEPAARLPLLLDEVVDARGAHATAGAV